MFVMPAHPRFGIIRILVCVSSGAWARSCVSSAAGRDGQSKAYCGIIQRASQDDAIPCLTLREGGLADFGSSCAGSMTCSAPEYKVDLFSGTVSFSKDDGEAEACIAEVLRTCGVLSSNRTALAKMAERDAFILKGLPDFEGGVLMTSAICHDMLREEEAAKQELNALRASLENATSALALALSDARHIHMEGGSVVAVTQEVNAALSKESSALETAKAHLARLMHALGSMSKLSPPIETYEACFMAVVLLYVTLLQGYCRTGNGYRPLSQEIGADMLFAAGVIYWYIMPVVLGYVGFFSSCKGGAPTFAYYLYALFAAAHFGLLFGAWISGKKVNLTTSGMAFLAFQTLLEHFDMATDVLFLGVAEACSEEVGQLWLASWTTVPLIGPGLSSTFAKMHLGGFALALFIAGAYVPQSLYMWSIFAVFAFVGLFGVILCWAACGTWVGLFVMLGAYALLSFMPISVGSGAPVVVQFYTNLNDAINNQSWSWSCAPMFEDFSVGPDQNMKALLLGMTKLALENFLQLWVQTSFLALAFSQMEPDARAKSLLSIFLGLSVGVGKYAHALYAAVEVNDGPSGLATRLANLNNRSECVMFWAMMLSFLCLFLFIVWIIAKLAFIFVCDSHVWNLSSGCVEVAMAQTIYM